MFSATLGGIGLFLLGMVLLTDGLKGLAGDSLRGFLARFAGGRLSATLSGALITALVQSSSATTLTTIGFVSAGLISFPQAVGVIVGANLGTTSTGWLVALLGLKLSVGKAALPLIGVGALLKLLTRERRAHLGLALSGFGLVFVGIDTLQEGMQALSTRFDPHSFPAPTLGGRLLLVLLGMLMTVVMQSSSAAVATTLTALDAGTLLPLQAAALVIGQNVGTTVTAGLSAMGGSAAARRTAASHVLFNALTGIVAFALLVPAVSGLERVFDGARRGPLLLAAFHTGFNLLGAALFLPLLGPFARLVSRLVPERGPALTRRLDPMVARGPLGLDAAGLTVRETLTEAVRALSELVGGEAAARAQARERLQAVGGALADTRRFLEGVHAQPEARRAELDRHLGLLHALDHLERLAAAAQEHVPWAELRAVPEVAQVVTQLERALTHVREELEHGRPLTPAALEAESRAIAEARRTGRPRLLEAAARGELAVNRGAEMLETVRWVDRLAYHLWRAAEHLLAADPTAIPRASIPAAESPGSAAPG